MILAAPGAMLASKISFRKALSLSVVGGIIFYTSLYFFELNLAVFAVLAVIGATFDRSLYWVPFHSGFAKFTDKKTRGRTLALLTSIISLLTIALPIIAGFVITQYGFNVLFLIVIFIYTVSMVPLFTLPPIREYYTFGYIQSWKILFHKRDRRILFTYMADGANDVVNTVIWPIFIWQILNGNYQVVGFVASLIILATIVLRLAMGNYADKFNKKKLLRYGTIFYSFGWLFKVFIETGFQVFIASTYHNFAAVAMRTPFNALMYEKAADSGHYMDEYSVLREMALNFGRVIMIISLIILFNFFGLNYAFALAAVAALFINFI
jgi:MFS family permease